MPDKYFFKIFYSPITSGLQIDSDELNFHCPLSLPPSEPIGDWGFGPAVIWGGGNVVVLRQQYDYRKKCSMDLFGHTTSDLWFNVVEFKPSSTTGIGLGRWQLIVIRLVHTW